MPCELNFSSDCYDLLVIVHESATLLGVTEFGAKAGAYISCVSGAVFMSFSGLSQAELESCCFPLVGKSELLALPIKTTEISVHQSLHRRNMKMLRLHKSNEDNTRVKRTRIAGSRTGVA